MRCIMIFLFMCMSYLENAFRLSGADAVHVSAYPRQGGRSEGKRVWEGRERWLKSMGVERLEAEVVAEKKDKAMTPAYGRISTATEESWKPRVR